MKWIFTSSLFLLLFCSHTSSTPINRWILFKKANGVEFYVKHKSSMYDTRYNTLVRLRNMNRFEVKVSFKPSFSCADNQAEKIEKGAIQTAIYPRHSVTLLAYRPCKGKIPVEILLNSLQVRRR